MEEECSYASSFELAENICYENYNSKNLENREPADVLYFGLMYDKEKDSIYLGEITEEQAKDYVPPKEVTDAYSYRDRKGFHPIKNFVDTMKMNTYGMYA